MNLQIFLNNEPKKNQKNISASSADIKKLFFINFQIKFI